jgi:elongation factor G
MTSSSSQIHKVALIGHGGSGKTTLAEALLARGGAIARKGRVEDGTTVFDFEPEELKRHLSVSLALGSFEFAGHKVNLLDTPGFADFFPEAQTALAVADVAVVVVSALEGVELQTEALWNEAARRGVPRIVFVNKLDHERGDFERVLDELRSVFGAGIAPLELPLYRDGRFVGVADLLADEAVFYSSGNATTGPIPDDIAELEHRVRDNLVEGIVVADDALMERYLDGDTPSAVELESTLANGIASGTVFPVLCGSATEDVAIDRLASFICEVATHHTARARAGDVDVEIPVDPGGEPLAHVFKTVVDPFVGRISYLEVLSGTLRPDTVLINARTKVEERLHVLHAMEGKNATNMSEVLAGDLVAVPKLLDVAVGDTLAPRTSPVVLPPLEIERPTLEIAIRPKTAGDEDRLMTGLHRLQEEDPALAVRRDDETHQTVLSGIGETHLQVACERLARKFNVEIEQEQLRVPYRETVSSIAEAEGRHKKQTGGHGQFGVVRLRIEPLERGAGLTFVDAVVGGAIPRQFVPAVEKGVKRVMAQGGAFGYPVVDVKVVCLDGKFHPVDSSEASFEIAGALAFGEALRAADPVPLEPISRLEVTAPSRYLGDVLGDVNARRARVVSSEPNETGDVVIVAFVPTAEITRYAVELRALSGGHGHFQAMHDHYDAVPAHLADKLASAKVLVS